MHLAHLRLRDFRNYARMDMDLSPGFHVLIGNNAQGKSNFLEAIYLLATLRSFRGTAGAQMVRHDQKGYFVGARVISQSDQEVKLYWSAAARRISINERNIRKLSEFLGVLRAVVFCTEDLQLVKGAGSRRRRFVDLLLSQTNPAYLPLLQRYSRTLRSRNALLKQRPIEETALESFTEELVTAGKQIMEYRKALMPRFSPLARLAYRRISNDQEELRLEHQPAVKRDFALELAQSRSRERALRSTMIGPHRDEIRFLLNDRSALQFASEGQKRSIAIALKMAQAEYLTGIHGTPPILLIDDVMGELDAQRRAGFLPLLQRAHQARSQVFMTVTEESWNVPGTGEPIRWIVRAGGVARMPS
ncbi:MAG: DNA replication/repair protein RecF [Verrucomicrobia bacterium]|nr:DNA replication/repair protein RecF [Verrucomicrobiota bacterium]